MSRTQSTASEAGLGEEKELSSSMHRLNVGVSIEMSSIILVTLQFLMTFWAVKARKVQSYLVFRHDETVSLLLEWRCYVYRQVSKPENGLHSRNLWRCKFTGGNSSVELIFTLETICNMLLTVNKLSLCSLVSPPFCDPFSLDLVT